MSTITRHIDQETIDRYGRINGDNDIIHYDKQYAQQRGYEDALAHGLMVMGYACEMAAEVYGHDWIESGGIDVRWVGPTYPNVLLTIEVDEAGNVTADATDPEGEPRRVMVGTVQRGNVTDV